MKHSAKKNKKKRVLNPQQVARRTAYQKHHAKQEALAKQLATSLRLSLRRARTAAKQVLQGAA